MLVKSVFEVVMLLCFGLAWPFSIMKSFRSRSTGGKSLLFLGAILIGYIAGLLKCAFDPLGTDMVVFVAYGFNFMMVLVDTGLYFRNLSYEASGGASE